MKDSNGYEHSRYGVNHVQTHLHTAVGVVSLGLGQSRHTVVTIPQDLNPTTVIFLPIKKKWGQVSIPHESVRKPYIQNRLFHSAFDLS